MIRVITFTMSEKIIVYALIIWQGFTKFNHNRLNLRPRNFGYKYIQIELLIFEMQHPKIYSLIIFLGKTAINIWIGNHFRNH